MHLINLQDFAPRLGVGACDSTEPPRNAARRGATFLVARHKNFVDRLIALRRMYEKDRGTFRGNNKRRYPHTTNGDVLQLATLWSRELARVKPRNAHDRTDHRRWAACMAEVAKLVDANKPAERYAENEAFWVCSARLAIYLESRRLSPSRWELIKESVVEAVAELPTTIGRATGAAAGAATDAAGAAANFVGRPARTALVVLGGALLLPPIIRAIRK